MYQLCQTTYFQPILNLRRKFEATRANSVLSVSFLTKCLETCFWCLNIHFWGHRPHFWYYWNPKYIYLRPHLDETHENVDFYQYMS